MPQREITCRIVRSSSSDIPEFAQFLVEEAIDSISFNSMLSKELKIF
jgi:hypothetical protein